jgi:octaprenyl-diphosphate synthase
VSIPFLDSLLRDDLAAVDSVLRESLSSDVALIRQVAEYIIGSGGKRLRPALVVLAAQACAYRGRHHHTLAATIEMIHTATLLHDDVVDESALRRGHATANAMFGNAASVLVGDFLYSRSFQLMVSVDNMRVLRILSDATNVIAEGEVLQLMNAHDPHTTEQRYLEVIYRKTAKLFEAGAEVAAVLSGATPRVRQELAAYGRHLGTAYQLVDDVLDYRSNPQERGKNLGDDLAEGKPTLPLIHALRHGNAQQRAIIREAIQRGGVTQLEPVLTAIEATGGLEYTARLAREHAARAKAALAALPESRCRDGLAALAAFSVEHTT